MSLSAQTLQESLKSLGLEVELNGDHFVHSTAGRYAPAIHTIITLDEDSNGATIISALTGKIESQHRAPVYELLNLVHGQSLWNVRFHVDEQGRVLSIGKLALWGKPLNGVQLGDIVFSLLVTTDRLYPCIDAIVRGGKSGEEAFSLFFLRQGEPTND